MIGEDEKINQRLLRGIYPIISLLLLLSACSVLDPSRLTNEYERVPILEEILKRDRVYTVRRADEAALIALLDEPSSVVRLATVRLMGQNPSQVIYDALLRAVLDENEDVADEASSVLLGQWEQSYKAVLRGLSSTEPVVVYSSIDLIRQRGWQENSVYLLTLFGDPRPSVRAAASRAFVGLNEYENPWFQSLLNSPRPIVRQTAVETLPRYNNPEIIPSLIAFILDPVPEVRTAAIFGISEFDKRALPALHETLRFTANRELKLNVLEIVDGILEPESIPVLVEMLSSGDSLISAKSAEILFRQGPDSIPELLRQMEDMNNEALLLSFDLIGRFQDQRGLVRLISYFDSEDEIIKDRAVEIVRSYGKASFSALVEGLDDPSEGIQHQCLKLLVEQRAPSLVYDSKSSSYPVDHVFYFFETSAEDEVRLYLDEVELSSRSVNALINLYEIELNTREYQFIRGLRDRDQYPYLYFFREWEDSMISAELSRESSFSYMHYYFDTGMVEWLTESKQLRDTAALFERAAAAARDSAMRTGALAGAEDRDMVSRYLDNRKNLAESWRALSSDIRNLAMLVFLRYSLDIETVIRDYDYFRTLPVMSSPLPQNL